MRSSPQCSVEAAQLVRLYGVARRGSRSSPLGGRPCLLGPGDQAQARRAVGLPTEVPVVLFVGRIQPLKGLALAIEALALLADRNGRSSKVRLVVIGGPSGPRGLEELTKAQG